MNPPHETYYKQMVFFNITKLNVYVARFIHLLVSCVRSKIPNSLRSFIHSAQGHWHGDLTLNDFWNSFITKLGFKKLLSTGTEF